MLALSPILGWILHPVGSRTLSLIVCPRERLRSCHLDFAPAESLRDTFSGVSLCVSTVFVAVIVVLCYSQGHL